jgi:hypothetical protein
MTGDGSMMGPYEFSPEEIIRLYADEAKTRHEANPRTREEIEQDLRARIGDLGTLAAAKGKRIDADAEAGIADLEAFLTEQAGEEGGNDA